MFKKSPIKISLLTIWLFAIAIAIYYYITLGIPLTEYAAIIQALINRFGLWGPLIYILIYTFRGLIFFPGTILTVAAGVLFGPLFGLLYTLIGANLSASVSFVTGRYFGKDFIQSPENTAKLAPYMGDKFRENGFISILIMRLVFLPFDIVSYVAGVYQLRYRDFALATFIGILPGTTTYVLLGSSLRDPKNLLITAFFFVLGIVIARYLKKKNA